MLKIITGLLGFTDPASGGKQPWLLQYRSSKAFILITISAAIFTDIFLYAVIVPVVPFSLTERAGVAENDVQKWVSILVAVYGGFLAVFSPFCGWAADASPNRRLPLVLGLFALAASTLMLNLGRDVAVLIVARALQGISAAVVWCVGLALVADTVPVEQVGESMGYVFISMSLALMAAPLLGGIVFDKGGYNAVFAMCYGLIGVDIALRLLMIEKKDAAKWLKTEESFETPVDHTVQDVEKMKDPEASRGASKEAKSVNHAATGQDEIAETSNAQATELNSASSAPAVAKRHLPALIILIKSRRLLASLWAVFVTSVLMTQFDSVLPLFVKETFGWSATAAGLIFLAPVIPSFVSPLVGWGIDIYGPRLFAIAGFALLTPFQVLLRLVDHNSTQQKVLLCAFLAMIGLSLTIATPGLMVEITYVVEQKEKDTPGLFGEKGAYAQAYGLFNLAWAAGALIGPIWAGFVREHAGWGTMAWSLALLNGVTIIPVTIWVGGSLFNERKRNRKVGKQNKGANQSQSAV